MGGSHTCTSHKQALSYCGENQARQVESLLLVKQVQIQIVGNSDDLPQFPHLNQLKDGFH